MRASNHTVQTRSITTLVVWSMISCLCLIASPTFADATSVSVFRNLDLAYNADADEKIVDGEITRRLHGQAAERTVEFPMLPDDLAETKRITAIIKVVPVLIRDGNDESITRPADPWTRMGSVNLVTGEQGRRAGQNPNDLENYPDDTEIELVRFITGFGGPGEFRQDVTALAPMLSGQKTIRVYLSTYSNPGWKVSVRFVFHDEGAGYRRPAYARRIMNEQHVTAVANRLRTQITIPSGFDRPRIRIISTGHATDGMDGDEFETRTHVLKIDGKEVARFRPWTEFGGTLRDKNPTSGRTTVAGRELWSSDLDRSGWYPSQVVQPLIIPVPELSPGPHRIELEVLDIRPRNPDSTDHGYWRISAIVVADEVWPGE